MKESLKTRKERTLGSKMEGSYGREGTSRWGSRQGVSGKKILEM